MKKTEYYNMNSYSKDSWNCQLDNDEDINLSLVIQVTNMYDATGEDEYKDYPVVFEIGILNSNIHPDIIKNVTDSNNPDFSDVVNYYGMNCYLEQDILDIDFINDRLVDTLNIEDACFYNYECRFTNKEKKFLKFKNEEVAMQFAEKLIERYADTIMTLVGFYLDKPINIIGDTAWEQVELLHRGK